MQLLHRSFRSYSRLSLQLLLTLALLLIAWSFSNSTAHADPDGIISGTVFNDANDNGVRDASEAGYPFVTVTAFNNAGTVVGTATTAANGSYSLSASGSGPYRIEFTLPSGFYNGRIGTNNQSSVRFISGSAASGVDWGIQYPAAACAQGSAPRICTVAMPGANPDSNPANTQPAMYTYNYDGTGLTLETSYGMVGSNWGAALRRSTGLVYTSAFLKRHSGLGSAGLGGIYVHNFTTDVATTFIDLDGAPYNINLGTVPSNSTRGLPNDPAQPSLDLAVFPQIGKVGLGGIDISDNDTTMYVVDLNNRRPIKIVMDADNNPTTPPTASDVTSLQVPVPTTSCPAPNFRPFAVKYHLGALYVGGICTAQTGGSLFAAVFRYAEPVSSSTVPTQVTSFPLTYQKGYTIDTVPNCRDNYEGWFAWNDNFDDFDCATIENRLLISYPQPLLSALDFDVDGSMVMAFTDRTAHQVGGGNYAPIANQQVLVRPFAGGDILRARLNANGSFTLESNGTAGAYTGSGVGNNQGPGGGEFYGKDNINQTHQEVSLGGLALWPADPARLSVVTGYRTNLNGTDWYDNRTGDFIRHIDLNGYFNKAASVGDHDLLCAPISNPIQLGNRIWRDNNGNGVQDASEPPVEGVQVNLYNAAGTFLATSTTDANGNYLFTSGGSLTITPGATYYIAIDGSDIDANGNLDIDGPGGQPPIGQPTLPDNAGSGNGDLRDSDAVRNIVPGQPARIPGIQVIAGALGQNDHSLDFGFNTTPLSVILAAFDATCRPQDVYVTWETSEEYNVLGFNLLRASDPDSEPVQLNEELIPSNSPGGGQGAIYDYVDATVESGTYYYYLDDVTITGSATRHGPVNTAYPCTPTAVTRISLNVSPAMPILPVVLGMVGMLVFAGLVVLRRR